MTDANTGDTAPALLSGTGLAATAYSRLVILFAEGGHRPSIEQWEAIADLLKHLENVANDNVEDAVYVSAIPAGTGKSTSLAAFASALCNDPDYSTVGMLILCNRVTEVHDMAEKLHDHRDKLCIIVAEKNEKTLDLADHREADRAQIVVATQASLKATLRKLKEEPRSVAEFSEAKRFHYLGKRRKVVAWDEAIAFSRPVVLNGFAVVGLAETMSRQSQPAAAELMAWAGKVVKMEDGQCDVPDFAAIGVDLDRLVEDASNNDAIAAEASALAILNGGTGHIVRDVQSVMVTCVPELPSSLLPVTVTDASAARGVHHESYRQMALRRRVIYLKEATKTYRNIKLRIIPTAASRKVYQDKGSMKGRDLIDMAVRYVRSTAPDDVLVVSYKGPMSIKGVKERSITDAIDARLTEDELWHPRDANGNRQRRVRHLTYGKHTATNDHKHVRHVLLMGLNFVPRAASYAAAGAAQDKPMTTDDPAGQPTEVQIADMQLGMLRDATLQAALRGHARMGVDGDCGEMELVIPQVRQSGLSEADYLGMFPGVQIRLDTTLMPAVLLKGKAKALSELVLPLLDIGLPTIPLAMLREELGMRESHFSRLIKGDEWKAWRGAMGLVQVRLPGGRLALVT